MCGDSSCDYLLDPPTYRDFLNTYLLPNRPVIIGPSLVSSWKALRVWVIRDREYSLSAASGLQAGSKSTARTRIDWDYLSREYGDCEVIVADCSTREFSDQKREMMPFREVVDLWKCGNGTSLYVKDWHLARTLHRMHAAENCETSLQTFYTIPEVFQDDWMNSYYSACTEDDFRFVYVGAAGTFTPLHRDVYASYSWSTNVCGRKRWWLFPPGQTPYLLRKGGEEHMETAYDVRDVDKDVFPHFSQAHPIVIEQNGGETIFVPSGWYHQVENLTDCISINHNWCNSVNLPSLYTSMCAKVTEVEHALEDVRELLEHNAVRDEEDDAPEREWIRIVQDVVEKDAGWNWMTFWRMVLHALRASTGHPSPETSSMWKIASADLTPPLEFVKQRIKHCYDDFLLRDRRESVLMQGLDEVVRAVGELL
ncbi:Clavaminate synthase-like protein [Sparassis latifolia]